MSFRRFKFLLRKTTRFMILFSDCRTNRLYIYSLSLYIFFEPIFFIFFLNYHIFFSNNFYWNVLFRTHEVTMEKHFWFRSCWCFFNQCTIDPCLLWTSPNSKLHKYSESLSRHRSVLNKESQKTWDIQISLLYKVVFQVKFFWNSL